MANWPSFLSTGTMRHFHIAVARTAAIQFTCMGLGTLVSIFITRALGVEARGALTWLIAFASCGSVLSLLGMGQTSKKYIAHHPEQFTLYAALSACVLAIGISVMLPLLYVIAEHAPVALQYREAFWVALALIPCIAISNLLNDMLVALGKPLHSNILLIVEKSGAAFLNIILLYFACVSPLTIISAYVAIMALKLCFGLQFIRPNVHALPARSALMDCFKNIRSDLVSCYASNLASFYASLCLTLALGTLSSSHELGYFAVCKLIVENILMVPLAIAMFTLPQLAKQTTPETYHHTRNHILALTVAIMLGFALPLYLWSDTLMQFLFGSEFTAAGQPLRLMIVGMIAHGTFAVCNQIVSAKAKASSFMIAPLSIAGIMTLLIVMQQDALSANNAAVIYSVAYSVGMLIASLIVFRKTTQD